MNQSYEDWAASQVAVWFVEVKKTVLSAKYITREAVKIPTLIQGHVSR